MVVRGRRQIRHLDDQGRSSTDEKLDAVLKAQKETNELLTLLVRACVRTVQVPAGATPPPNAVRIDEGIGPHAVKNEVVEDVVDEGECPMIAS